MAIEIHPTAEVQTHKVGDGSVVYQHSVVLAGATIGRNCNINCHVFIENKVTIGDSVTIKPGVQLWDETVVGDHVFIGPNATFTNDVSPRSKRYPGRFPVTRIEEGASVGANATILPGLTIGRYSLIGAGSVVTADVPPFAVCFGNPARQRGYATRAGTLVALDMRDEDGRLYTLVDGEPVNAAVPNG